MDYSSLPNDPDHPAGTSPWDSASTGGDRGFPAPTSGLGDVAPSPFQTQQPLPYGMDGESQSERPGAAENGASGSPQFGAHDHHDQPSYTSHQQAAEQKQRTAPGRFHGARQQGRQNSPQYKLQAKITGLERVGKKDPVLRFDVHVSPVAGGGAN